jgi:hypothetical protein
MGSSHFTTGGSWKCIYSTQVSTIVFAGTTDKQLASGTPYAIGDVGANNNPMGGNDYVILDNLGNRIRFSFSGSSASIVPIDNIAQGTYISGAVTFMNNR